MFCCKTHLRFIKMQGVPKTQVRFCHKKVYLIHFFWWVLNLLKRKFFYEDSTCILKIQLAFCWFSQVYTKMQVRFSPKECVLEYNTVNIIKIMMGERLKWQHFFAWYVWASLQTCYASTGLINRHRTHARLHRLCIIDNRSCDQRRL